MSDCSTTSPGRLLHVCGPGLPRVRFTRQRRNCTSSRLRKGTIRCDYRPSFEYRIPSSTASWSRYATVPASTFGCTAVHALVPELQLGDNKVARQHLEPDLRAVQC